MAKVAAQMAFGPGPDYDPCLTAGTGPASGVEEGAAVLVHAAEAGGAAAVVAAAAAAAACRSGTCCGPWVATLLVTEACCAHCLEQAPSYLEAS